MAVYPFKDFVTILKDGVSKALRISGYDADDDMLKMKSVQKKWKDSFTIPNNALNITDKWDLVQTGAGMGVSVSSGELVITSGTTINAETILMTKETFTDPFRAMFAYYVSQKIANTDVTFEAVSVNPSTGQPDGLHSVAWRISGSDNTTTTNGVYITQNGGFAPLVSSATTIPVCTAYSILELELFADEVWYHTRVMDSANGRSVSTVRHQQIPDPNAVFKIRVRVTNRAVAPASSTTLKMQYVTVVDYAELTAEITAGRGNVAQGQGLYATVGGTVSVSGNPAMVGNVAHDSPISGNPVRTGARAVTSNVTVSAHGDVVDNIATLTGAQINKNFSIPELDWSYQGVITASTADTAMKVATASVRNYLTGISFTNTGTATQVYIKDGATIIWTGFAPVNVPVNVVFSSPIKTTVNTALNFTCVTSTSSMYVSAQGYQAP